MINLNATVKGKDHDGYKAITVHDKMWHLVACQGDVVPCMTPEGPSDDFCYYVRLINFFSNVEYQLNTPIMGHIRTETCEYEDGSEDICWYENARIRCQSLIEKMKEKGQLDLQHWTQVK